MFCTCSGHVHIPYMYLHTKTTWWYGSRLTSGDNSVIKVLVKPKPEGICPESYIWRRLLEKEIAKLFSIII